MSSTSSDPTQTVCYRHHNRATNVRCSNCDRPICTDCMTPSPVGMRCPECAPQRKFVIADDLLITKGIIGICVTLWVLGLVLSMMNGSTGALTGAGQNWISDNGELFTPYVAQGGEWWRLVTSGFLHAGLLHLAFNMYFIWIFGGLLEPILGRLRFGLLFLACLLAGSIGAILLTYVRTPTVGASGAGFGLMGAGLVLAYLRQDRQLQSNLVGLVVLNFAFSFIFPGISIGGHLGGFLAGLLLGYVSFGPLARQRQRITAVFAAAVVVFFVGGIVAANVKTNRYIQQQVEKQQQQRFPAG